MSTNEMELEKEQLIGEGGAKISNEEKKDDELLEETHKKQPEHSDLNPIHSSIFSPTTPHQNPVYSALDNMAYL